MPVGSAFHTGYHRTGGALRNVIVMRWRALAVTAVLVASLVAPVAAPVVAGASPTTTQPVAAPASVQYSAPDWLPLRTALGGGDVRVGCTYLSTGSQGGYDCAGHHATWAIDFGAPTGTPVYAAGSGWATVYTNFGACDWAGGYGRSVIVNHGFGVVTIYAHLSSISIAAGGQQVTPATKIGEVGTSGASVCNFPHLHFERLVAGVGPVDPGQLKACHGGTMVSYPAAFGRPGWQGLPWGAGTVRSDGQGCVVDPNAYRPAVPVTRAEMAAFLWRNAGRPSTPSSCEFADEALIAAWARPGACWMKATGITDSNPYRGSSTVTRAEMATFVWRAAGRPVSVDSCGFVDADALASWAKSGACWMKATGITDNNPYRAGSPVTRAEMAAFLWRAAGSPPAPASCNMSDEASIPQFARTAVCWMKASGITTVGV